MTDPYNRDATNRLCDDLGAAEVRARLVSGGFHVGQRTDAEAWLSRHESALKERAEERSEESLRISRKALSNSSLATRIATFALILSVIMAIQKLIEWSSR